MILILSEFSCKIDGINKIHSLNVWQAYFFDLKEWLEVIMLTFESEMNLINLITH